MQIAAVMRRHVVASTFILLGAVPCVLGILIGFGLSLTNMVWLTDTSGIWPIFCMMFAIWLVQAISESLREANNGRRVTAFRIMSLSIYALCIFAFVGWTSLYFSRWTQATKVPFTTAIVSDGVVHKVSENFRDSTTPVHLMTTSRGKTFVHNVEGKVVVQGMEAQYKFDKAFIATRASDDDLAVVISKTLDPILTPLSQQSRTKRVHLLSTRAELDQIGKMACLALMRGTPPCPLSLKLTPTADATVRSQIWSTEYTDAEAIAERHIPSLTQFLADDALAPAQMDAAFAIFMEGSARIDQVGTVARKSHTIKDEQFNALVDRIIAADDGGDEAGVMLMASNRLSKVQRRTLREKVLREASVSFILKNAAKLHLKDDEVVRLSSRLQAAVAKRADVATAVLETFGERLPSEVQSSAIETVALADAGPVIDTLRAVNFSPDFRERIVNRLVALGSAKQLPAISRSQLQANLAPRELGAFVTAVIPSNSLSKERLDFAVQTLPISAMTRAQQKTVVDELMFASTKAAFEFVSLNRTHMDAALVNDVTRDYAKTIDREFCLHLTHRNANRRMEYFSADQVRIFQDCARDGK